MLKRIVSILLSLVLVFASCSIIFSTSMIENAPVVGFYRYEYSENGYLESIEYMNGDYECKIYFDNELSSSAYYTFESKTIVSRNYSNDNIISESSISVVDLAAKVIPISNNDATRSRNYMGRIQYQYYIQGSPFSRYLDIDSEYIYNINSRYNLNNFYQNGAALIALLVTSVGLSYMVAPIAAADILIIFGKYLDDTSYFIPDFWVKATENRMNWYATCGSVEGCFSGAKYVVVREGYSTKTYYESPYYTTSYYNSHNANLADALKNCINVYWGDGSYTVLSWE